MSTVMQTVYRIHCLAGEDVRREPGRLFVCVKDGILYSAGCDEPLELRSDATEELRGWGELDGPSYLIGAEDCAWTVNVPRESWMRLLLKGRLAAVRGANGEPAA